MPSTHELDVKLRAYVPAFEHLGGTLPAPAVTRTNIGELREATGLTWEPATEPQYRLRSLGLGAESAEIVPGLKYVTRGEGGPVLGSCKESYRLFTNAELFRTAEMIGLAAVERKIDFRFIAGGEVDGGRRVYLLAEMGSPVELTRDPAPYVRYVTLLSSHNGSGAVKVLGTSMRWRCTNALHMTELDAVTAGAAFSFRHTAKIGQRMTNARTAITASLLQHRQTENGIAEMLGRAVKQPAVSAYLHQFALQQVVGRSDPHRPPAVGSGLTQHEQAIDRLEAGLRVIYESPTCDGIRDTAYGPFAAVVEYMDNVRPATSQDTRFDRTMINNDRGKILAFDLLRDLL